MPLAGARAFFCAAAGPLAARLSASRTPLRALMTVSKAMASDAAVPLQHRWVPLQQKNDVEGPVDSALSMKIVSYNILAQVYVKRKTFPHSPDKCLRRKFRFESIVNEFVALDADFLCLQELDEFEEFYRPALARHDYGAVYVKRPGRKKDGCGVFYKKLRFNLVTQQAIDYNDIVPDGGGTLATSSTLQQRQPDGSSKGNDGEERGDMNDPAVRFKRDCVGLMAAFRPKGSSTGAFVVVSTHLFWDPALADVKLAQAKHLLACVRQFCLTVQGTSGTSPPAFICGDFNSQPGDEVHAFLTRMHPNSGHVFEPTYLKDKSNKAAEACAKSIDTIGEVPAENQVPSAFSLKSLYSEGGPEPKFTTFTPTFTGTLDYIFFTSDSKIVVKALLAVPEEGDPSIAGGLPNFLHPSDHLPIGGQVMLSL